MLILPPFSISMDHPQMNLKPSIAKEREIIVYLLNTFLCQQFTHTRETQGEIK